MKSILVSIPNTGYIHKHCVFALLKLSRDPRVNIILPTHNPLENNFHHIIKDFMDGEYEWWLSFDSDNPPKVNPLEAIEYNKDIIGFPTPVLHFTGKKGERPVYWNVYREKGEGYTEWTDRYGLQQVDAIGSGCMLINRRVFEEKEMRQGPFLRKTYGDGRVHKGTDISFCERARENGFEVWADFDRPCMHFNEVEITEMVNAFRNLYE